MKSKYNIYIKNFDLCVTYHKSLTFFVNFKFRYCLVSVIVFMLLQIEYTIYASDVFSKRDCPLVWKLVEYTFNHETYLCKCFSCERSKQTVNASQDRYKIPSC